MDKFGLGLERSDDQEHTGVLIGFKQPSFTLDVCLAVQNGIQRSICHTFYTQRDHEMTSIAKIETAAAFSVGLHPHSPARALDKVMSPINSSVHA